MKKTILLIGILTAFIFAEFDKVGTTTAQFLKLGVGARALGMGGSFVALADDGSATYWNPAGLANLRSPSLSLYHNPWVLDIKHEYLSMAFPQGRVGTVGFFVSALTMGEKEVTTVNQPEGTGIYYSTLDLAVGASYAMRLSDRFSYGLTLKYIRLSGYNETAGTVAFDLGSILRTNFYDTRIGISLSNFGGELTYSGRDLLHPADIDDDVDGNYSTDADLKTQSWPLPMLIRIGIGCTLIGDEKAVFSGGPSNRLIFALDAVHPNDSPEYLGLGLEYGFRESLYLRCGYRLNHVNEALTFGAGLTVSLAALGKTRIDYAVIPMGVFGSSAQLSLEFQFN
ncbi:MAG: UPF0164 family protein [FCB group bacterium]|nr:UPF0164 family protein [FCB group bacterium]